MTQLEKSHLEKVELYLKWYKEGRELEQFIIEKWLQMKSG